MDTYFPFATPFYMMAKPAGAQCNLACDYCYYLEKAHLYPRETARRQTSMTDATLERFIRSYLEAQTTPEVLFTWHGGETLLRPISFYKRAIELQKKYGGGRPIDNCIQTNGTLLTDQWAKFFHDEGWLVGVSIDGPERFHDEYRRNRADAPSFAKVMAGIDLLRKHSVEWNALAVVNDYNADHPEEFYDFFKSIDCRFLQFSPIVERLTPHADGRHLASPAQADAPLAPFSVSPAQWGEFLCRLFNRWVVADVGKLYVQIFDSTLANWVGVPPGVCSLAPTCGHAGAMEFNGDVYVCDHFVFPEYKLGNIHSSSMVEMMCGPVARDFGEAKRSALPHQCRECPWLKLCNGECPKNRIARTPDGEPGLNYLCQGYARIFAHTAPAMQWMAREYQSQRPPAAIMAHLPEIYPHGLEAF